MSEDQKTPDKSDENNRNIRRSDLRRQKHNQEIIKKMNEGESLTSFDSLSSWFPPRPKIKKDKKLIDQLYSNPQPRQTLSQEQKSPTDGNPPQKSLRPKTKQKRHLRQVK